jgi:hypothetical protein
VLGAPSISAYTAFFDLLPFGSGDGREDTITVAPLPRQNKNNTIVLFYGMVSDLFNA